jgi:hypothetical protein
VDPKDALQFLSTKISLKLSFKMGAKFRFGMIASLEKGEEKLGMNLQASSTGLSGSIFARLEGFGIKSKPVEGEFKILDKSESELLRWVAFDGGEPP